MLSRRLDNPNFAVRRESLTSSSAKNIRCKRNSLVNMGLRTAFEISLRNGNSEAGSPVMVEICRIQGPESSTRGLYAEEFTNSRFFLAVS